MESRRVGAGCLTRYIGQGKTLKPLGALLFITALAAGCSGATGAEPRPLMGAPFVVYQLEGPFQEGDGALLEGELRLENDCLVVVSDDGVTSVPQLPDSVATWQADEQTLMVDAKEFVVGDRVSFGGGYFDTPITDAQVPLACNGIGGFFVVSST